jgi:hypothetical protein
MALLLFIPGLLRMQSPVAYTSCSEQRKHNKASPATFPTLKLNFGKGKFLFFKSALNINRV